ncbi:MAG: amidohydrolase, partial [Pirellulaceae bacterium]|nr:amidohydrolase [Pirellulaceae bacterium]
MLRRSFLTKSTSACTTAIMSAALGSALSTPVRSAMAAPADLPIIDTHQHLWDLIDFKPPWLSGAPAPVAAKHDMQDYRTATANLNVVKAVYMEVDVAVEDQNKEADFVLGIIRSQKTPTVAAVISGRPGSTGFAAYMERFRNEPTIKGVRQVLHAPSAEQG